jgi:hypothetical protein
LNSNLRYYLNPINKKYEPVSFDNGCAQKLPERYLGFLPIKQDIVYKMLFDESFRKALIKELNWWQQNPKAKELLEELKKREFLLKDNKS